MMNYSNNLILESEKGNIENVRKIISNISTLQHDDIASILGKTFISDSPELLRRTEDSGWTALKFAISKGYTEIVRMILHLMDQKLSGEAIEKILCIREPALTVAISKGHTDIVRMILHLMDQKLSGEAIERIPHPVWI